MPNKKGTREKKLKSMCVVEADKGNFASPETNIYNKEESMVKDEWKAQVITVERLKHDSIKGIIDWSGALSQDVLNEEEKEYIAGESTKLPEGLSFAQELWIRGTRANTAKRS